MLCLTQVDGWVSQERRAGTYWSSLMKTYLTITPARLFCLNKFPPCSLTVFFISESFMSRCLMTGGWDTSYLAGFQSSKVMISGLLPLLDVGRRHNIDFMYCWNDYQKFQNCACGDRNVVKLASNFVTVASTILTYGTRRPAWKRFIFSGFGLRTLSNGFTLSSLNSKKTTFVCHWRCC